MAILILAAAAAPACGTSEAAGAGSGELALADAMAIVCSAPAKAKQDPKWDHAEEEGGNFELIATYLRPALANPDVRAAWRDDRGGPWDKRWLELVHRAGLSSCGFIDYMHEASAAAKKKGDDQMRAMGLDPASPIVALTTQPPALCPRGWMPTKNVLLRLESGSDFLEEEVTNFSFANTRWVGRTATVKIGFCQPGKPMVSCDRATLAWFGSHKTKITGDDHHVVVALPPGFQPACKELARH